MTRPLYSPAAVSCPSGEKLAAEIMSWHCTQLATLVMAMFDRGPTLVLHSRWERGGGWGAEGGKEEGEREGGKRDGETEGT